jgi:type IV pilus assembly protein PilO
MAMDIKDPKTQKTILIGMAMAGIGYLYFFATFVPFGYRAMSAEKKELQGRYEQLSSDLNKARQTLSSMARVEREFQAIQKRYEAARVLLPEEKEVANLLRMVSLVGQQAGVTFELFKPLPAVTQGYYVENPVDVRVTGGYHAVGAFLADVANLSRIVKVSNLTLGAWEKGSADETVQASFTASAYTLNPNPAPPAPEARPAGKKNREPAAVKGGKGARNQKKSQKAKEGSNEDEG